MLKDFIGSDDAKALDERIETCCVLSSKTVSKSTVPQDCGWFPCMVVSGLGRERDRA